MIATVHQRDFFEVPRESCRAVDTQCDSIRITVNVFKVVPKEPGSVAATASSLVDSSPIDNSEELTPLGMEFPSNLIKKRGL